MARVHIVITGRVQGVGFRWFVSRRAKELNLDGWVRNQPDGSVEVEAEGEPQAISEFVVALREGPSRSRVEQLIERHEAGPRRYLGFAIIG